MIKQECIGIPDMILLLMIFCFKKIKIKAEIVLSPGGAYFFLISEFLISGINCISLFLFGKSNFDQKSIQRYGENVLLSLYGTELFLGEVENISDHVLSFETLFLSNDCFHQMIYHHSLIEGINFHFELAAPLICLRFCTIYIFSNSMCFTLSS